MDDDHQRFCRVSYWRETDDKHLVSTTKEKGWTKCVVGPLSTYSPYGEQTFVNGPHAEHQINSLISLLRQAYEFGKRSKLAEIQHMLGIPTR